LVGVIPRVAYVNSISHEANFRADSSKYYTLAKNIYKLKTYTRNTSAPYAPETFITPGYPLFVATTMLVANDNFSFFELVLYAQALLGGVTVLLVFLIANRFLPVLTAFIASFLVAISPQLIVGGGYLLTETLFTFLFVFSLYIFESAIRQHKIYLFLLFGLIAGCAALVRPAVLMFPILVFVPIVLINTKNIFFLLKRSLLVLIGILVFWGPWIVYKTHSEAAGSVPQSAAVDSFALGSYPDLVYKTKLYRGYPYFEDPEYRTMQKGFSSAFKILMGRAEKQPLKYLSWYLVGKPVTYWQWGNIAGAGGPFIYPVKHSIYESNDLALDSLLLSEIIHPVWVVSAFLVCLVFVYQVFTRNIILARYPVISILASALIYFTVVHSVLAPLPRYSYPVLPVLYLMSIYGIWVSWGYYKQFSETVYNKLATWCLVHSPKKSKNTTED